MDAQTIRDIRTACAIAKADLGWPQRTDGWPRIAWAEAIGRLATQASCAPAETYSWAITRVIALACAALEQRDRWRRGETIYTPGYRAAAPAQDRASDAAAEGLWSDAAPPSARSFWFSHLADEGLLIHPAAWPADTPDHLLPPILLSARAAQRDSLRDYPCF